MTDRGTTYGEDVLKSFKETWEKISSEVTGTNDLSFHMGANARETMDTRLGAVNVTALGISDVDLSVDPRIAIVHIDDALKFIGTQRGLTGAQWNRFDATINALSTSKENTSARRSRIEDADIATQTASLLSVQIMQRSVNSMLAHANAVAALALQPLR